jgi:signal transduction histidine kinase/ActR/RegA family two-component response regulator
MNTIKNILLRKDIYSPASGIESAVMDEKPDPLGQSRDFATSIVETVRQPLLVLDMEFRIKLANRAFYQTFQVTPLEAEGQVLYALSRGQWDIPGLRDLLDGLAKGGSSFPDFEFERDFPGIGHRHLVVGGCRLDPLNMIVLAVDDVTEPKEAEMALRKSDLRQSRRMEAIGRLAGGIAHDSNNLLTAIIGYSDLLIDTLAGDEPALQHVLEIKAAGDRAASLTQQLLALSRRQVPQPKVLDLNLIVANFERTLRRLVGERIAIVIDCPPSLWRVRADPGEIGRAIMNLALNARDAMPDAGTMTIETANVTVAGADAIEQDLAHGRYVTLAVRDTGIGMDAETKVHIFEPFFTTKEAGKGAGLGLASVLSVVEQSGGAIRCMSEPSRGTTFKIFLPEVADEVEQGAQPLGGSLAATPKGTEVVLLVDDESAVLRLARRILQASGYVVLAAGSGREGLALCESHQGRIDLLLTDVTMPDIGGRELAEGVLKLRPGIKVMFMSGHMEDVFLLEGIGKGAVYLQKPWGPIQLAQKVREALDSPAASAGQP